MEIELDNPEFQNVWRLVNETNSSVFMTGRAGTGKSTFLRYIVANTLKKTIVLAPTGIAAVNAGGVTLHSFFKIPLQPFALDDVNFATRRDILQRLKMPNEKVKLMNEVELIVIDEASMVRADVLDFVDRVLRTYVHGAFNRPFGGKQLLLVGDAFQLEPVVPDSDWDILRRFYQTPYFFSAAVFAQVNLVQVELQKVYRQKEVDFLHLLDRVRTGNALQQDFTTINSRVVPDFIPSSDHFFITLTSTRASSDSINKHHLDEIAMPQHVFEGVVTGDFPESSLPSNKLLVLKVGAQVVFLRNDQERRWYNGTICRVSGIENDGIWVEIARDEKDDDGNDVLDKYFVEPTIWENVRYRYNEEKHKVENETIGTFKQLPVKLAWAITIHKSQGLTFDNVIIDMGRGAFACGQSYVALSRCRTLAGIVLRQPLNPSDIRTNQNVRQFAMAANNPDVIRHQFELARVTPLLDEARSSFANGDYRQAVISLFDAIAIDPSVGANPVFRRYVARKLDVIRRKDAEIGDLLARQKAQKEKNFEFAYEFYLLAVECFRKYDDTRSAKANVNKALQLSPDYADALLLRAEICSVTGELDDAEQDLTDALRSDALPAKRRLRALRLRAEVGAELHHWHDAYNDLTDLLLALKGQDLDDELLALVEKVKQNCN